MVTVCLARRRGGVQITNGREGGTKRDHASTNFLMYLLSLVLAPSSDRRYSLQKFQAWCVLRRSEMIKHLLAAVPVTFLSLTTIGAKSIEVRKPLLKTVILGPYQALSLCNSCCVSVWKGAGNTLNVFDSTFFAHFYFRFFPTLRYSCEVWILSLLSPSIALTYLQSKPQEGNKSDVWIPSFSSEVSLAMTTLISGIASAAMMIGGVRNFPVNYALT